MSENKQSDWKEREVGALWKQSGNGKTSYCTGYITSDELGNKVRQRVIMFANKNKSNDKSPDFIIYISKNLNEEGGSTQVVQRRSASPEFEDVGPQEVPI